MTQSRPEDETIETTVERFARLYGTSERGARLWAQWMETQTETTRAVMEQVAADAAAERSISIEEARTLLALEKLIEDRGPGFVDRFLRQHDWSARPLRPMQMPSRRKR